MSFCDTPAIFNGDTGDSNAEPALRRGVPEGDFVRDLIILFDRGSLVPAGITLGLLGDIYKGRLKPPMIILSLDLAPDEILPIVRKDPAFITVGAGWLLESGILQQIAVLGLGVETKSG